MKKLFLDFDNCIVDSIKAYCDVYNEIYQFRPNFKKANPYLVEEWDFKDQCPLASNCNDIFSFYLFFEKCEFINPNTEEVINKLCEKYEVIVASIGTPENIAYKSLWLKEKLPCIKNHIFLVNDGCTMDKSSINMENSIFIDDVASNLESSNATYKICFGEVYKWNEQWKGKRAINWTDIENLLL